MDYAKRKSEKALRAAGQAGDNPQNECYHETRFKPGLYAGCVARPCLEIQKNPNKSYELTGRWNVVMYDRQGAFDVRAGDINDEMKIAAAYALAGLILEDELHEEYIIPEAFDPRIKDVVASAVATAARKSGVARM